jgi:hypothetical protein
MKFLKFGLRLWITGVSLLSFLAGWIMLGHAPKPNQSGSSSQAIAAPLPTLEPLPSLSQDGGNSFQNNSFQNQPFFSNQPRNSFRQSPFFSTGGS